MICERVAGADAEGVATAAHEISYFYTLMLGGVEDGNADTEYVDRSVF